MSRTSFVIRLDVVQEPAHEGEDFQEVSDQRLLQIFKAALNEVDFNAAFSMVHLMHAPNVLFSVDIQHVDTI